MANLWRVGLTAPRYIFEENSVLVCRCRDAETAAKIVEAVNRMTEERTDTERLDWLGAQKYFCVGISHDIADRKSTRLNSSHRL